MTTVIATTKKVTISLEHEALEETKALRAEIVFGKVQPGEMWSCYTCTGNNGRWFGTENELDVHARMHVTMARWYQTLQARNGGRLI